MGAGNGVVGDRGVVLRAARRGGVPGDEHRAPVRADRHRRSAAVAAVGVELHPQLGAGSGRHERRTHPGHCHCLRGWAPEALAPVTPTAASATPAAAAKTIALKLTGFPVSIMPGWRSSKPIMSLA